MTNGEKIKATFPHYDIEIDEHKGYVRVFYEDFYTTYPLRWWNAEYKELTTRNCFGCKYSKDNHNAGTEECHLCMWENQYTPTTKNDLGVDCIKKSDAINIIQDMHGLARADVISDAVNRIITMSSVTPQKPRWIPVSEYLPVTNDEVLVTYIVNGNAKKRYVETANCFDGEWSSVNDEYRIPNTKIEIIAWCEMPKPYKAESEDKE